MFSGDPDIGGRYSALSRFRHRPRGADRHRRAHAARRRRRRVANSAPGPAERGSGAAIPASVWLGAALSALARSGRDKLTFVIADSLPGLGLWLEQLVAESTGKHGTGILPVAEEPLGDPGDYGEDRVFAYLPDLAAPDPQLDAPRRRRSRDAGPPAAHDPHARARAISGACSCSPSSPSRSPAGALRSTPSTSPTCSRPRTRPSACSPTTKAGTSCPRRRARDGSGAALAAARRELRRSTSRSWPIVQPSAEFDAAARRAARGDPRGTHRATTHVRLRPALPALDRPVPQGRPEDRALPAAAPRRPRGRRRSRARAYTFTTLKNAAGDRRPARRCASSGCPAERVRLEGEDPVGALRALTARIKEAT